MNLNFLKKYDNSTYIVLFLTIIGFFIRLFYLNNGPLWNDELATLYYATQENLDEVRLRVFYNEEPFTHIWFWWKRLNYYILENLFCSIF